MNERLGSTITVVFFRRTFSGLREASQQRILKYHDEPCPGRPLLQVSATGFARVLDWNRVRPGYV